MLNKYFSSMDPNPRDEEDENKPMANGDNAVTTEDIQLDMEEGINLEMDPELGLELERIQLEKLRLQHSQLVCKQRLLLRQAERRAVSQNTPSSRCVLPGGKVVVRTVTDGAADSRDMDSNFTAAAGDSNERDTVCSCKNKKPWEHPESSVEDDRSTPSTCVRSERRRRDYKDKSKKKQKSDSSKLTDKIEASRKSTASKTTDLTSRKSDYSKYAETVSKRSDITSKKLELVHKKFLGKHKSEMSCDLKYVDFCSDSEDEADETNRLIHLRNTDYMDIVNDHLKIVLALAGYPKSKMRLRQMEQFQRCLSDVMDMQIKAGLLQKLPSFLDYYLNRGAIVCICKDADTRDWMVRVSPGLQERMCNNLILLRANVRRLCLAVLKVPKSSWPASAQDVFKLLQYFNPTLKTHLWRVYSQKTIDDVECTSFLIDRVSGEIIRGRTFKNVIDYNQMEFELVGYTEIYHECLLSDLEADVSSVASRVKLLEDIKSARTTPAGSAVSVQRNQIAEICDKTDMLVEEIVDSKDDESKTVVFDKNADMKQEVEETLQKKILKKLKDVKYVSKSDEIVVWSDDNDFSDPENGKSDEIKIEDYITGKASRLLSSGAAVSDKTESFIESNDNLTNSRNSNLNIDSTRGIAYHRRTNYLHVENELKIAITLDGYPQNKLEGTHIRRLKHLFKEYLHKDMKNQRFANLIIPRFQDIYLSNGAVIYVCDSLETKDYLTEILPKFVNSTGLKLTFRDVKKLVRYTRIVMRLPKEHSNVESVEVLLKLQTKYPGLKPDCWKYYSDVAGKQKRQFGVDPESLEVIKSSDFDPTYEGEKISFRIIDRQKRDVSFEEPTTTISDVNAIDESEKSLREKVLKKMYVPIDPEITKAPLTRIRTNHYSDLIADDLKLFVSPADYPHNRVDEVLFHSIKRILESNVYDLLEKGDMDETTMPKFHDMYLFDGVIFIICLDMPSRIWIEKALVVVNSKLHINLKTTEFRGAVGIISMVVKTDKDTDEVVSILQSQNPRLRTKYWRKISTVKTKTKLDVVLQIDKLSAQVITNPNFNKYIGPNTVQFKLGHLQSLLKPKSSLEELSKMYADSLHKKVSEVKLLEKSKSKVSMQGPKDKSFEQLKCDLKKEYPALKIENWDVVSRREMANHQVCDLEIDIDSANIIETEDYKLSLGEDKVFFYTGLPSDRTERSEAEPAIEPETPKYVDTNLVLEQQHNTQDSQKMILKIPMNILPDNKDDLNIIFDILEDKNPGLNTELWQVFTDNAYPNNGKFTLLLDKQSAAVVKGKTFDPSIGGEKLKFYFLSIPGLQPAGSRACLTCSARADLYCGRCEVAPYCSTGCQRRDWHGRHRYVCHNLAQLSAPLDVDEAAAVPPPTPLRQPHVSSRPTQRGADSDGENGRDEDKQKKTGQNSYIQKNSPNAGRSGPRGDNRTDNRSAPRGDNRSDTRNAYRGDNRNDNRGERTDNRADNRNENRFGNRNENRNDNRNENRSDNRYGNQGDNRNENRTDNRNGAPKNFRPQLNHENGGGPKGAYRYRQQYNPRYNEQRYHNRDDGDWDAVKPEPAQPKPVQDKPVQSVQTVPVQRPVQATPVQAVQATPVQPVQAAPVQNAKPPVNVADVTPAKKIVPKECLIDTLPVGALVLLSADARGAASRARAGLVCLAMHDSAQAPYEALCDQYAAACETLPSYKPTPGETFSYLDRSDGGWYRARCVAPTLAALIDSGKMVPLDANDRCCKLPPEYEAVPEFCCLLTADQVQIGDSLRCTLVSKTPRGFSVTLEKVESGEAAGRGELTRWLPEVEYPRPAAPVIPAVARPPLSPSQTLLVDATPERAFVRPASLDAQRAFDDALQAAVLYGRSATPLREPPLKGQVVISKFTDDLHYRALVQRTNARQNKYLIEYIEFGNTHISKLEDLYACPPNLDLANKPTVTSEVKLPLPAPVSFTPAALEYIEKLKDEQIPLMMTLTNGAKSAPSGAEVILTVEKNKEVVHKRLVEMCTPEWKKIEERGGDVVESEHIMFSELEYLELPPGGCELDILDMSLLHENILSGCERGLKLAAYVFTSLTDKMGEYCNSAIGREPYLPKENELCIAKCPPYPQWFRGVVAECSPGGAVANVCFVDYGNLQEVPVSLLRKMLPEFVRGLPAVAFTIEVQGFPERPTEAQLLKAAEIMKVTEEGRGVLRVSKCVKGAEPGCYVVEAPELIKALNAV